MNPDDFKIVKKPYSALFDRDGLNAKVAACEASGHDPSFFVGVLSRMDAYEANLSSAPRAPTAGLAIKSPSPV